MGVGVGVGGVGVAGVGVAGVGVGEAVTHATDHIQFHLLCLLYGLRNV